MSLFEMTSGWSLLLSSYFRPLYLWLCYTSTYSRKSTLPPCFIKRNDTCSVSLKYCTAMFHLNLNVCDCDCVCGHQLKSGMHSKLDIYTSCNVTWRHTHFWASFQLLCKSILYILHTSMYI